MSYVCPKCRVVTEKTQCDNCKIAWNENENIIPANMQNEVTPAPDIRDATGDSLKLALIEQTDRANNALLAELVALERDNNKRLKSIKSNVGVVAVIVAIYFIFYLMCVFGVFGAAGLLYI